MGAWGQDRLTESSDVYKKRVSKTGECEEVMNSIFLVQKYEKHKNQM